MHRCLEVFDVVLLILGFLDAEGKTNEQHSLVSMALTNHHFLEPAMNVLWATQEDIFNLLKCLPGEIWHVMNDIGANREVDSSTLVRY